MATPPPPPDEPLAPGEPPAGPPGPDAEAGSCPRCGTPYAPGQEYCLECGLRLPLVRGIVPALGRAWRRRIPWYPGDWIWPVLLGLVIAALGATVAILATRDEKQATGKTFVGTLPVATGGDTTSVPPEPSTSVPTETSPTPTEPPPTATTATTPPATGGALTEWPAGTNGYTVVLESIPTSGGRGAATRAARKASDAGLSDVGVLDSSDYSSLHPGYYVVFSGVFNFRSEAAGSVSQARSGAYPKAYPRRIAQ